LTSSVSACIEDFCGRGHGLLRCGAEFVLFFMGLDVLVLLYPRLGGQRDTKRLNSPGRFVSRAVGGLIPGGWLGLPWSGAGAPAAIAGAGHRASGRSGRERRGGNCVVR